MPEPWFSLAWEAIRRKWIKKERPAVLYVEENHIVNNRGWKDYHWAGGIATSNNSQESNNRHKVRHSIASELRKEFPRAKLPVALLSAADKIFTHIVPRWSAACKEFEDEVETTALQRREAARFAQEDNLLTLAPHVYCYVQKKADGTILPSSADDAHKVISLWSPQRKKWTYKDFKQAARTRFTTKQTCFPCHEFACKGMCYHVLGIRLKELQQAEEDVSNDEDLEDDIIEDKTRGGIGRGSPKPPRVEFRGQQDFRRIALGQKQNTRKTNQEAPSATCGLGPAITRQQSVQAHGKGDGSTTNTEAKNDVMHQPSEG